jgi:hypothetical protein
MVIDPHYDTIDEILKTSSDAVCARIRLAKLYFHRTTSGLTDDDSGFRPQPGMLTVFGQVFHVAMGMEAFTAGIFGPYEGIAVYSQQVGLMDLRWMTHQDIDVYEALPDEHLGSYVTSDLLDALAEKKLSLALRLFDRAMDDVTEKFSSMTAAQLMTTTLPRNPMFPPGYTIYHVLDMLLDHAALHRGALSTYTRLLGKRAKEPWMTGSAVRERAREMENEPEMENESSNDDIQEAAE